jgi:hypothetical protein
MQEIDSGISLTDGTQRGSQEFTISTNCVRKIDSVSFPQMGRTGSPSRRQKKRGYGPLTSLLLPLGFPEKRKETLKNLPVCHLGINAA